MSLQVPTMPPPMLAATAPAMATGPAPAFLPMHMGAVPMVHTMHMPTLPWGQPQPMQPPPPWAMPQALPPPMQALPPWATAPTA